MGRARTARSASWTSCSRRRSRPRRCRRRQTCRQQAGGEEVGAGTARPAQRRVTTGRAADVGGDSVVGWQHVRRSPALGQQQQQQHSGGPVQAVRAEEASVAGRRQPPRGLFFVVPHPGGRVRQHHELGAGRVLHHCDLPGRDARLGLAEPWHPPHDGGRSRVRGTYNEGWHARAHTPLTLAGWRERGTHTHIAPPAHAEAEAAAAEGLGSVLAGPRPAARWVCAAAVAAAPLTRALAPMPRCCHWGPAAARRHWLAPPPPQAAGRPWPLPRARARAGAGQKAWGSCWRARWRWRPRHGSHRQWGRRRRCSGGAMVVVITAAAPRAPPPPRVRGRRWWAARRSGCGWRRSSERGRADCWGRGPSAMWSAIRSWA